MTRSSTSWEEDRKWRKRTRIPLAGKVGGQGLVDFVPVEAVEVADVLVDRGSSSE